MYNLVIGNSNEIAKSLQTRVLVHQAYKASEFPKF